MSPARARETKVQHLDVKRLCFKAALKPAVIGRVWPEEIRRALSGISHLYGLHALDLHLDRYTIELDGFASERFPREAIAHQIGLSTGIKSHARQEKVHGAIVAAFGSEFAQTRAPQVYLHGFGVFSPLYPGTSKYVLDFEDPLARYFSVEDDGRYATA